jgi:hypothetical protein
MILEENLAFLSFQAVPSSACNQGCANAAIPVSPVRATIVPGLPCYWIKTMSLDFFFQCQESTTRLWLCLFVSS